MGFQLNNGMCKTVVQQKTNDPTSPIREAYGVLSTYAFVIPPHLAVVECRV